MTKIQVGNLDIPTTVLLANSEPLTNTLALAAGVPQDSFSIGYEAFQGVDIQSHPASLGSNTTDNKKFDFLKYTVATYDTSH